MRAEATPSTEVILATADTLMVTLRMGNRAATSVVFACSLPSEVTLPKSTRNETIASSGFPTAESVLDERIMQGPENDGPANDRTAPAARVYPTIEVANETGR
jgi:hypothetical protein